MTSTVLIYIKPDAEAGQPLRDAFAVAYDEVLSTLVAWELEYVGSILSAANFADIRHRLGASSLCSTSEYVGDRRIAEQSVRA
jgi:hypothetical protein